MGRSIPTVVDPTKLTDGELLEWLQAEYQKLPITRDRDERRKVWSEIDGLNAELQSRYPGTAPLDRRGIA